MNEVELNAKSTMVKLALSAAAAPKPGLLKDLLTLAKVRVVSMLVFTALVGEMLVPRFWTHWAGALAGLCGIAFAGGAGGTLNQLVEPVIDQNMRRTHVRPLASGRISRTGAMIYAASLFSAAVIILSLWTNMTTLLLTLAGTVGYGVIYTIYLKPSTPWNIVWGGIAGALPPLIGWTAVGAPISTLPIILVLLIFVWTPAHFWPLSLYYREDYAKAHIPMLPVTHGVDRTRYEIVKYAFATLIVSLLPPLFGDAGLVYVLVAAGTGIRYLTLTVRLQRMAVDKTMERYARSVFSASITYLFLIYATLVLEHLIQMVGWVPWWF